jgi:nucleotide-binding universal stress UspA family protein
MIDGINDTAVAKCIVFHSGFGVSRMTDRLLQSIVHPTDFSPAGLDAFVHALRLAVAAKGQFYILHIEGDTEQPDWVQFPRVRETLAAWGMIAPDAPQSAVASELGLKVDKAIVGSDDPVRGVESFVERHQCDLLVLMTHAHPAPQRWLHRSIAEAAARHVHAATLFLREGQEGFVDRETGAISLQRILLPIDGSLPYRYACRWVEAFEQLAASRARVHPLHVGTSTPTNASEFEGTIDVREGPIVETIISVAEEIGANIIAMPTAGHHGLLDALRGSVTERVLREAPCPVLAVPVM